MVWIVDDFGTNARVRVGHRWSDGARWSGSASDAVAVYYIVSTLSLTHKNNACRGGIAREGAMEVVSKGGHHDGSGVRRKKLLWGKESKKKKGIA